MEDEITTKEQKLQTVIKSATLLNGIQDIDVLLETLLTEARHIVNADAGSIYIREGDNLSIRYAQNDTQQAKLERGQKMVYSFFSFPISTKSIAGYSAVTGQAVNEDDVYNISSDKTYAFNKQTDILTGYKTTSNMAIPLKTASGKILGVLQVLNAKKTDGTITSFDDDDILYITHFANNATHALDHAHLTRLMVMRMVTMAGLRDPKETGAHVNRVANYAVEIYDRWAFNTNVSKREREKYRDILKIAAMLHDIGKIAIPDEILKKPVRFTEDEYKVMQQHTWKGAALFADAESQIDEMARDVALTHHENWNGTGYPGSIDYKTGEILCIDENGKPIGLKGEEISIAGRIVALADVFDALSSKRVYKESWTADNVLTEISSQAGKKFDPAVVQAFNEVLPNIKQIQQAYPDNG